MNDFKIGDKVRFKKLSEEEFEEVYHKKYNVNLYWTYNDYLNSYEDDFNQIFEISRIDDKKHIYCKNYNNWFYKEELEKVNYLKIKFKIINKILNNNI